MGMRLWASNERCEEVEGTAMMSWARVMGMLLKMVTTSSNRVLDKAIQSSFVNRSNT